MTMHFHSFERFAEHLIKVTFEEALAVHTGLEVAARLIESEAKAEIGKYQRTNTGPYAPWAELSDFTKADRVQKGFAENEPLLRTGALRDSISHKVGDLEATIGSTSQIMVWQEMGTGSIPPRAVLGLSAHRNREKVIQILTQFSLAALLGKIHITPESFSIIREINNV